jgi:hypothetical protein
VVLVLELIHLLQLGPMVSPGEHRNEFLDSITEGGQFFDHLIEYLFLKKTFSQWCFTAGWSISETI